MSYIDPRGFGDDFPAWADQMSYLIQFDVPQFWIWNPAIDKPEDWREWAMCIVGGQDRLGQDSPDPDQFATWQEWAQRLFETQEFLG